MTPAEINACVDDILQREGRTFTHVLAADGTELDPPTKYGITDKTLGLWRVLGRKATPDEVRDLRESEAREIYKTWYITDPHFDRIQDARLACATVDFGVNSGVERAAFYLQKAAGVTPDMKVGPITLANVNALPGMLLLGRLTRARVQVLTRWIRARPQRIKFIAVIDRAVSFLS